MKLNLIEFLYFYYDFLKRAFHIKKTYNFWLEKTWY